MSSSVVMEACFQGDTQSRGHNIHICWSLVGPPGGKKKLLEQHLGERYILWNTLCLVFLIETIRGASYSLLIFFPSMYSFSAINNQNLKYLWNWTEHNLTISNGRLFFRQNPKLCMSEIYKMWDKTGIAVKPEEGDFRNNGERANCE